ncbi:hypothetical protein Ancab_020072 [Ancistrocladus abbreviatus]
MAASPLIHKPPCLTPCVKPHALFSLSIIAEISIIAVRHHRSLPLPGCASPRRTSDEWCVSGDWEFYVSYLALDFPPDSYKLKKQKQLQVCSGRHPPGSSEYILLELFLD